MKAEATQKAEEECGLIGIVVMNSVQSGFPRWWGRLFFLQLCSVRLKHINGVAKRVHCFFYKFSAANGTIEGIFAHQECSETEKHLHNRDAFISHRHHHNV